MVTFLLLIIVFLIVYIIGNRDGVSQNRITIGGTDREDLSRGFSFLYLIPLAILIAVIHFTSSQEYRPFQDLRSYLNDVQTGAPPASIDDAGFQPTQAPKVDLSKENKTRDLPSGPIFEEDFPRFEAPPTTEVTSQESKTIYLVQLGFYNNEANAVKDSADYADRLGLPISIVKVSSLEFYLGVGPYRSKSDAMLIRQTLGSMHEVKGFIYEKNRKQ